MPCSKCSISGHTKRNCKFGSLSVYQKKKALRNELRDIDRHLSRFGNDDDEEIEEMRAKILSTGQIDLEDIVELDREELNDMLIALIMDSQQRRLDTLAEQEREREEREERRLDALAEQRRAKREERQAAERNAERERQERVRQDQLYADRADATEIVESQYPVAPGMTSEELLELDREEFNLLYDANSISNADYRNHPEFRELNYTVIRSRAPEQRIEQLEMFIDNNGRWRQNEGNAPWESSAGGSASAPAEEQSDLERLEELLQEALTNRNENQVEIINFAFQLQTIGVRRRQVRTDLERTNLSNSEDLRLQNELGVLDRNYERLDDRYQIIQDRVEDLDAEIANYQRQIVELRMASGSAPLPSDTTFRDLTTEDDCPICLEKLIGTSPVIPILPCGHWIHVACKEQLVNSTDWSGYQHSLCPVCRQRIMGFGKKMT